MSFSNIQDWVLETQFKLFKLKEEVKRVVIDQAYYANDDLVLAKLCDDSEFFISVLLPANLVKERLGTDEGCKKLSNRMIDINKHMVAACRIEEEVWPYIIVLDFKLDEESMGMIKATKNISTNEKVIPWTNRIKGIIQRSNKNVYAHFFSQILVDTFIEFEKVEQMVEHYLTLSNRDQQEPDEELEQEPEQQQKVPENVEMDLSRLQQDKFNSFTVGSKTVIPDGMCIIPSPPLKPSHDEFVRAASPVELSIPAKVCDLPKEHKINLNKLRNQLFVQQYKPLSFAP